MRLIHSRLPEVVGAGAICIWPIGVLVPPGTKELSFRQSMHEGQHWKDQRVWGIALPLVGVLLWYLLYLLVLPVGWNPFRFYYEARAMRAEAPGIGDAEIRWRLRQDPWRLWWH